MTYVEGLTDQEIRALIAACELTGAVADELAGRHGVRRKMGPRETARMKLIVTLGTREETRTGMASCN